MTKKKERENISKNCKSIWTNGELCSREIISLQSKIVKNSGVNQNEFRFADKNMPSILFHEKAKGNSLKI